MKKEKFKENLKKSVNLRKIKELRTCGTPGSLQKRGATYFYERQRLYLISTFFSSFGILWHFLAQISAIFQIFSSEKFYIFKSVQMVMQPRKIMSNKFCFVTPTKFDMGSNLFFHQVR